MTFSIRRIEIPLCRQRVFLVPVCIPYAHHVATCRIDTKGRIQREAELLEFSQQCIPFFRALTGNQIPLPRNLAETMLLVVVVHVDRPWLNVVVLVHRLEQAVVMRQSSEPQPCRILRIHLCNAHLAEVRRRSQAMLLSLVQKRRHDRRPVRAEFQSVCPFVREVFNPFPRLFWRQNLLVLIFRPGAERVIGENSRRNDLVFRAAFFFLQAKTPGRRWAHRAPW